MQWITTHVDFRIMAIVSDEGKVIGLLTPNRFHNMYHLNPYKVKCNMEYLDNFYVAHLKPHQVMKPWYKDRDNFKDRVGITKYSPRPFISPVQYLETMLSLLHGEADYTNFKSEWLSLAHGVTSINTIFNWSNILSTKLI